MPVWPNFPPEHEIHRKLLFTSGIGYQPFEREAFVLDGAGKLVPLEGEHTHPALGAAPQREPRRS